MNVAVRSRRSFLLTLTTATCMSATSWSYFAAVYPAKPVEIVVPFNAGGVADHSSRNLVGHAAKYCGKPVDVINHTVGNGVIGSQFVEGGQQKGYTLSLARTGLQILLPAITPDTTPYSWKGFTFVGLLDLNLLIYVVHADSPYRTFNDLVAVLKEQLGKPGYSYAGVGTVPSLALQLILNNLGLQPDAAVNVPYKDRGEPVLAVISRQVDFSCGILALSWAS